MNDPTDPTYSTDPADLAEPTDLAEPMDPIEDLPEPLLAVPDEERFIEDPATFDPSDEDIRDAAAETGDLPPISDELADRDAARQLRTVEPGAEGPLGSGVEGADDVLVESTDDAGEIRDASGSASDVGNDLQPAAEQGHRIGDDMVAHGDDPSQVEDHSGDGLNVDTLRDDGAERVDDVDGLPRVDGEPDDRRPAQLAAEPHRPHRPRPQCATVFA